MSLLVGFLEDFHLLTSCFMIVKDQHYPEESFGKRRLLQAVIVIQIKHPTLGNIPSLLTSDDSNHQSIKVITRKIHFRCLMHFLVLGSL